MALHGKDTKINVSTTKGSGMNEVDGINDMSFGPKRDQHETTDFKSASAGSGDYDEAKTYIVGLKDGTGTISGQYEPGDTNGQVVLETAADGGTTVWMEFLWDGTNGHTVECLVDRTISAGVGDTVNVSFDLRFTSAWDTVP
jgi:hypothetical protein